MANLVFNIVSGALPVLVEIVELEYSLAYYEYGEHTIYGLDPGTYTLHCTDINGCAVTIENIIFPEPVTTTTTTEEVITTTTTSTTEDPTTTTTTILLTTTSTTEETNTTTTTFFEGFQFKVSVGDLDTVGLPLVDGYNYNFTVDYGDGSPMCTVTSYNDADASHTYTTGDSYIVTIIGTCEAFDTGNYSGSDYLYDYITDVINWGNCGFLKLSFDYCELLTTLPLGSITGASGVTECEYIFEYTSIETIPEELFYLMPNITTFYSAFAGSLLSYLPYGLFNNVDYDIIDTYYGFAYTFHECAILTGNAIPIWNYFTPSQPQDTYSYSHMLDNYCDIPYEYRDDEYCITTTTTVP